MGSVCLSQNATHPSADSGNYMDRRDKTREDGHRISPRYKNKSSYIERHKDRYDRGSSDSPGDRKVNHLAGNGSYSNHSGEQEKSYSKPSNSSQKDTRTEVQKSAVSVYGDWSEHVSSSGKRYYYNCKTEVSQWEKPKDWADIVRAADKAKEQRPTSRQASTSDDRSRHSSGGDDRMYRPSSSANLSSKSMPQPQQTVDKPKISPSKVDMLSQRTSVTSSRLDRNDSHATATSSRKDSQSYNVHYDGHSSARRARRDSEGNKPTTFMGRSVTQHSSERRNDEYLHGNDIDISPESIPFNSRSMSSQLLAPPSSTPVSSLTVTHNTVTAGMHRIPPGSTQVLSSLPQLISELGGDNNADRINTALQTLQKLQEVISKQVMVLGNTNSNIVQQSPLSTTSPTRTMKSPHRLSGPSPQQLSNSSIQSFVQLDDDRGRDSPQSERSHRSGSPTPSTSSSRDAPISTSTLSAAGMKRETSIQLTASHSNYYNDRLIGHVRGWQADHAERQATRYWEQGINVGSVHSSQVSVELKKARSSVRVAEIQSTLQEQRILFLTQQIKELENIKSHPPQSSLH